MAEEVFATVNPSHFLSNIAYLIAADALRQLRGEANGHQVSKAERALVTGIGWLNYGRNLGTTAALILERKK